ncbi:MAG: NADH-quinone oxidoreductase subunit NuoK [Myxococcales bacterium]|nr:NADH-quinone oxidoreductase subunit NuoK [Myxococcales bacterium]
MSLTVYLLIASALFSVGVYGLLTRKQLVAVLLSVELMANAANLVMVAFSHFTSNAVGQVFTLFALALTVAEVAVGLAIALLLYRTYASSNVDDAQEMKG